MAEAQELGCIIETSTLDRNTTVYMMRLLIALRDRKFNDLVSSFW
jgi:hypothetical protein